MIFVTTHKLIKGNKKTFEQQCDEAASKGYTFTGNLVVKFTLKGFLYVQLFTKTIKIDT
jgi:hypothetical protein